MWPEAIFANETKGGICIKIELNPQKNISLLQHGSRFFVYSSNMVAVTSCEHTITSVCLLPFPFSEQKSGRSGKKNRRKKKGGKDVPFHSTNVDKRMQGLVSIDTMV